MSPQARTGLLAFAAVGGLFLALGVGVGAFMLMRYKRDADAAADQSQAKYEAARAAASGIRAPVGKPRADKEGQTWNLQEMCDYLESCGVAVPVNRSQATASGGRVAILDGEPRQTITLYPTAHAARDAVVDRDSFHWGRFKFTLGSPLDGRVKRALGI
jgi:hypothetical protein